MPKKAAAVLFIFFLVVTLFSNIEFRYLFIRHHETQYTTTSVTRANIEEIVLASGTVGAQQQVSVGAQVSGQLKSLKVTLGETVKKGQLIAEIDAQTQQNVLKKSQSALAQMRAQLRAKQASAIQIQQKFNREHRLREGDASSHENYEAAHAALQAALADIDSLNEQIDQANITVSTEMVNLGYTRIAAPMDGTIVAIVTREGQTVNSAQLTPTIVVLAALDTMTIKAQVSEADVTRVKLGQLAYFTTLGDPDHRFSSNLNSVELAPDSIGSDIKGGKSAANAAPVYYNASFDIPNPDNQLRIAMTVQVSIVLAAAKNALVIPVTALSGPSADGRYQIEVLETLNGKPVVTTRQVRIGIRNVMAEVLEGVSAGEQVVTGKSGDMLRSGYPAGMHRT